VKGHAEVTIPGEVRQRIGVTVGKVEQAPLRMTIRTIGIVQADETKVAHVGEDTQPIEQATCAPRAGSRRSTSTTPASGSAMTNISYPFTAPIS
jgi:hypothetical protein